MSQASSECRYCSEADRFARQSAIGQRATEIKEVLVAAECDQEYVDLIIELCDLVVESEHESLHEWFKLEDKEN